MGCYLSAYADDGEKTNNELCDQYVYSASKQRRALKRSYFPHLSNGSSSSFQVSSACTSPSRPSLLSRCSSPPSSIQTKLKAKNFIWKPKKAPASSEFMTICDDFHEAIKIQAHQENKSSGYYSESLSTESNISTPSQSFQKRRTRITYSQTELPFVDVTPTPCGMEMEMYMISRYHRISRKTSSPICQRRNATYDVVSAASPSSHSYQKWSKYLQTTPTSVLHNVTNIPEAIAGHFSPLNFPAFTDLEEMESAAKRFKVDIHQKQMRKQPKLIPILTTDL